MLSNIGIPGLILVFIILLIVFGPSKLPELGRACGQTLREFRKFTRESISELEYEKAEEPKGKLPPSNLQEQHVNK